MGPPMDEERINRMLSDPNVQQSMNEALNNPDFINMLIDSNPMLRNMPNAREIINSPFMRQMMTNPQMMSQAMRMQRSMGGREAAFPAPGATDTTPADAAASGQTPGANSNTGQTPANPLLNPFLMGGAGLPPQLGDLNATTAMLQSLLGQRAAGANPQATGDAQAGQTATGAQGAAPGGQSPPPANPFAALFGAPGGGAPGASPFADPQFLQQALQEMQALTGGGGFGAPAAPADNRPPEVRYEEQLRQLNDMGFYDFDRNVAALRRSGGSVQGAIEHLLNSTD
ncbi:hypothetical protein B0I35DRAFT_430286 [Stachybotrys elegans]|uniref:UBA domain-containing protein n=1 Tax=Stachybotrys elegans TaxID=80388 RepID=A0A8K0SQK1_9HYPO|nr:hypothetical protein B0I35DRAFT_430286 [Stachybotrys elegans]